MCKFGISRLQNALVFLFVSAGLVVTPVVSATQTVIPEGTTVYLATNKTVTSRKKETAVGDLVTARVWRDVVIDGQVVIKRGTRATSEVASVSSRKILGIKGTVSIVAIETETVDGQTVHLTGGYHEEGKSRVGLSVGVGILLMWPILFARGTTAELPAGTVMDSYTSGILSVNTPDDLGPMKSDFTVEVLYGLLVEVEKPAYLDFLIMIDSSAPTELAIDVINNTEVKPIKLAVLSVEADEEQHVKLIRAMVGTKQVVTQFKKGINTFEISYHDEGRRVAEEVILEIEF